MIIPVANSSDVLTVLDALKHALKSGKVLTVEIKKPRDQKTTEQLGYIFGGIFQTVLENPYFEDVSLDDLKDGCCQLFTQAKGQSRIVLKNGLTLPFTERISGMSRERLSEFIDFLLHYFASPDNFPPHGIYIQTPDEYFAKQTTETKGLK